MENNNQENHTNTVNDSKFKTVSNPGTYKAVYEIDDKPKRNLILEELLSYHFLVVLLVVLW